MLRWTEETKVTGPKADGVSAAVTVGDTLYCFGGACEHSPDHNMDVYVFNTVSLHWEKLPPVTCEGEGLLEVPSRRCGHTAVLIGDIVYIWGGNIYDTGENDNVLYAFDVNAKKWFKPRVSGTVPEGRFLHSACVSGEVMFIHGGLNKLTNEMTNDIYKLDTTTMAWSLINTSGTAPPATGSHSATIIGTKMFLFGGYGERYYNNPIRVFDTETNYWLTTPLLQLLPERRESHSAFAYNGELYVYGGSYFGKIFNDLWKFSPQTFSWKEVELKEKGLCPKHSLLCCFMLGDRLMGFGVLEDEEHVYMLDLCPRQNSVE